MILYVVAPEISAWRYLDGSRLERRTAVVGQLRVESPRRT
jgi:hypothetical protein